MREQRLYGFLEIQKISLQLGGVLEGGKIFVFVRVVTGAEKQILPTQKAQMSGSLE